MDNENMIITGLTDVSGGVRWGQKQVRQYLSSNGDGTGTEYANGNYASSPLNLYLTPSNTQKFLISELIWTITGNSGNWAAAGYGSDTITNGVKLDLIDVNNVVIYSLIGDPIKFNADLARKTLMPNPPMQYTDATQLAAIFRLHETQPVFIDGALGQRLRATFHDNFATTYTYIFAKGVIGI